MAKFTIYQLLLIANKITNDALKQLHHNDDEILNNFSSVHKMLEYITNNEENARVDFPSLEQEIEYKNTLSEVLKEEIDFNYIKPF
ncbi:hypothetical protein IQ247_02555 [Plectonema cf. radiosum LEGE 06105]|uniref:Uncharacterized protein n=1 Tax=Plectonema cf. radiosum LEGE 06105 TaxID=945769 RepID=A0A8J7JYR2_9CYAN|nr:hypothetical protein [Plectonema radiosum]MBE9211606.1 hypothetical protein [Plectonema cf. radiosum LEGE 06105]